ncbi:MAG TPA: hypothetical protein VHW60_08225 [Caulobacteraceae bacterium]|jgi:hypothetical protein|nr:hypothetical protein [Caulobacteraceae bacterium]
MTTLAERPSAAQPAAEPETPPGIDPAALGGRPILMQTPVGAGKWSLEQLLSLTQEEGIALWRELPAPTLQEMNGHYMGLGPEGRDVAFQKGYANYMFNERSERGYWLGKAFRPLSATEGEGYNRWRFPGGRVERNLRMATRVQDSIIDAKPCYVLDYGAVNRGMTLYDELRRLDDGVLIGTATWQTRDGGRSKLNMFVLIGPTDEWVGAPYGDVASGG